MTGVISKFVLSVAVAGAGGTAIGIPLSSSSSSGIPSVAPKTFNESLAGSTDETRQVVSNTDSSTSHLDSVSADDSLSSSSVAPSNIQADLEPKDQAVEETVQQVETGNCTIIDSSRIKIIFESEGQEEANYYSIFCEKIEMDDKLEIPNKFEGAFPRSIFKESTWGVGKKLDIKVKTDMGNTFTETDYGQYDEENSETEEGDITFLSKQFIDSSNSLLKGRWGYKDFGEDEAQRTGEFVKLTQPAIDKYIYLLSDLEESS